MESLNAPFIVATYIPCKSCGYPCVIIQRFDHSPTEDELDRHVFHSTCENCGEMQARVGRDAFKRTVVEWNLQLKGPQASDPGR